MTNPRFIHRTPTVNRSTTFIIRRGLINRPWLALALTLAACMPALLIDLGTREVTHTMENVALAVSQETWLRWHAGDERAWAITFSDGVPRVEKPPMTAWLNALAWSGLDPKLATPTELVRRARLITVGLALVMLAAVFWMAKLVHDDVRVAIIATLAVAATFFFQRQARTASYDMHYVAWLTLATAAMVWGLGIGGEVKTRWRGIIGAVVAGASLAFAVLSKGPLPAALFVAIIVPTIAFMPVSGARRIRGMLLALLALFVAGCASGWWYLVAFEMVPSAGKRLLRETVQPRDSPQPWYYYVGLLGLLVPWTIWLIGGLVQPWTKEWRTRRSQLLIPWLWFFAILIVMSIPPAKQQRYILPIVPAAGLLIAHAWRGRGLKACGEAPAPNLLDRLARDGHWAALLLASIAAAAVLGWPTAFDTGLHKSLRFPLAIALGLALLGIVALGRRWHKNQCVHKAACATAAWMLLLMIPWWHVYSASPSSVHLFRVEAERLAEFVGDSPVHRLHLTGPDAVDYNLNMEFRLYFGRLVDRTRPADLRSADGPMFVLALDAEPYAQPMNEANYQAIDRYVTNKEEHHVLWKR